MAMPDHESCTALETLAVNPSKQGYPSVPQGVVPPMLPGINYIAVIKPSLTILMIEIIFSSMLIPLLFALFWFSTAELRRKPIFILNIIAILFCMTYGSISAGLQVLTIIDPIRAAGEKHTLIAAAVFCTLTPIFVESLLILRLLVVYPPTRISRLACFAIYAPPIALQIARIVNNGVTMHEVAETYFNIPNVLAATEQSWQVRGTRIEFFLQVIDNAYMSILFLIKVYQVRSQADAWRSKGYQSSYANKLRTLFYIAASNFVFPVMLSLAQLIFLYVKSDYYVGIYMATLFFMNGLVQVLCLLLATVWVASNHSQDQLSRSREPSDTSYSLDSHTNTSDFKRTRPRPGLQHVAIPCPDLDCGCRSSDDVATHSWEEVKSPSLTVVHSQAI